MVELFRGSVHINAIAMGHGDCKGNARPDEVAQIVRPPGEAEPWPSKLGLVHGINDDDKHITKTPSTQNVGSNRSAYLSK